MSSPRLTGRLAGLLGFVAMSAVAGVLAAVTVTPAIAVVGMAASDTIGVFEDLPDYLEIQPLAQRTNVYAKNPDGSDHLLAYFYAQNRINVGWDQVNGFAKNAAIAGEDPRFYDHGGIDMRGTASAVVNNALGRPIRGGSSITQQYVKNVIIQNAIRNLTKQEEIDAAFAAATEQSEARKIREMRYAIGLEKAYSKDEILLGYLNIAGFAGNIYGIEAAANYYFSTSAANLTLPQAASLVAIVNSPEQYRLDRPDSEDNGAANGYAENKGRRDYILDNMLKEGMITQQEHDDAIASAVEPAITQPSAGCTAAAGEGFFCDYVKRTFENNKFFGETQQERLAKLYTAGYDVYTTLDMELQQAAESAINDNVPMHLDDFNVGASVVTVQPGSGNILAMAQNKIFSDDPEVLASGPQYSAVNYNADYQYGASTGFQPGSTYKIFTLLEWLKEGHGVNESMDARKRDWQGTTWRDSCVDGGSYRLTESYNPRNDEGDNGGNFTALFNTQKSKNTGFIAMANKLDLCGIRNTAADSGVYRADRGVSDPVYDADGNPVLDAEGNQTYTEPKTGELLRSPATVLGTNEIAPLQMAGAFATIAAGGNFCEPRAIDRIVAADGSDVGVPPVSCKQVYSGEVAAAAAYALQSAFENGTGQTTEDRVTTKAPTIGKTGTTDDAFATWMSGATTKAATVTGVYNVTGFVNQRSYRMAPGVYASDLRHMIAPRVMSVANAKWGGDEFPEPTAELLRGQQATVPDVRGLTLDQAKSIIEGAGFSFQDGGQQDSDLPTGTVIGTNPSGTTGKGTLVQVFTSNQALKAIPNVVGSTPSQAGATLAGAGFRSVSSICQANPSATPEGTITAQDPAGGTATRAEQQITVTITRKTC